MEISSYTLIPKSVLTRRQFNLRALGLTVAAPFLRLFPSRTASSIAEAQNPESGFPEGDYTPFGYLNNPYHSWALNRSGVLRSVRGIGFGWHYPAGPGGYFDEKKNGIYSAFLRLGFAMGEERFWAPEDFREGQLRCPYHSGNLLTYEINVTGGQITCTFLQVGENALAVRVELSKQFRDLAVLVMAAHQYRLGNAAWWGGDGVVGHHDREQDCLVTRSFAAGTVFAVGSDTASKMRFFDSGSEPIAAWFGAKTHANRAISYGQDPLQGGITYELVQGKVLDIILAREVNESGAITELRRARQSLTQAIEQKRAEDDRFWSQAPRLEGDWPQHWKNGWVYDFETLRMMVRRPVGAYKHSWDAMQIQAPRNVLAETSIDMWALSHADPETAQEVLLGQFLDALQPNVPCMREDGVMNMVAADGSECGTSISWCYPFFCASSIYARTGDRKWLGQLYPRLAMLLRWTIANRSDGSGFILGKCSWETGMDGARRFLIEQPTGAELIEFIRIVELQAAAAQAGRVMEEFARELGNPGGISEWSRIREAYSAKTQQLWNSRDWFHDFDTRGGKPITSAGKDIGQVAPVFCRVTNAEQERAMAANLRSFYDQSLAGSAKNADGWTDGLQWSSLTLPYLESLWSAQEYELLANVIHMIAERIYPSMDRRNVPKLEGSWTVPRDGDSRIGIPGVSCEMWTPQGAVGGEGYGWGAVLPVHIMRSLIGIRESGEANKLWLCPNLPSELMESGKSYRLKNWRYRGLSFLIHLSVQERERLSVDLYVPGAAALEARDSGGHALANVNAAASGLSFAAENRKKYTISFRSTS